MPPEPYSWDRNNCRDKNRSSDSSSSLRSVARWRDSPRPGGGSTTPRWDDDFRRPPPPLQGHGKHQQQQQQQGGGNYQLFPEGTGGYGCMSFRDNRMVADDNIYRPFTSTTPTRSTGYGYGYGGKYATRNTTRDTPRNFYNYTPRGGSSGSGSSWDNGSDVPRQQHYNGLSGQGSVSDLLPYHSHHNIDTSSWDHPSFRPRIDALATPHRADRAQSFMATPHRADREQSFMATPHRADREQSFMATPHRANREQPLSSSLATPHRADREQSFGSSLATPHRADREQSFSSSLATPLRVNREQSFSSSLATPHRVDREQSLSSSLATPHRADRTQSFNSSLATPHRADRTQSFSSSIADWKPLKWNRSTSLSSRPSGFTHTSSSRSLGGVESEETKPYMKTNTVQSPSGTCTGANGGVSPNANSEDTCPRKKQRLGWGQGLAKYEKQKVEVSDETLSSKSTLVPCGTIARPSHSVPSMPDKSPPRVTAPSECASPVTTSSVACSSSQGIDDSHHITATSNDIDAFNLRGDDEFQSCLEEFSANLEYLNSATNLSSLLSDVLHIEDASSGDSNFVKSTAMSKLLLVKNELSKALEKTECEIDLFENEIKTLKPENESSAHDLVASGSLEVECITRSIENMGTETKVIQKPAPLQLISSSDMHTDNPNLCNVALEEDHCDVKDDDIDSPGTATSKFVEPLCMEKAVSAYGVGDCDPCLTDVSARPASSEKLWCRPPIIKEKAATVSGVDRVEQNNTISAHVPNDLNLECNLKNSILIANKNSAGQAFEELRKLLPTLQPESDIWGSCNILCQKNISLVKERLAPQKRSKRFKDRVLTLKFRALQHLWKEDLRLLSVRKYKAKSQKRIESNSRTPQFVYQKHRSSIRSRFTSPAGSLTLVPTTKIVDFTSKLLSDSQIKLCRDSLKMPSLVDEKEKSRLRFASANSLVEDPCAAEKERVMINPWTPMEKEVFLEKFETFGKNFKKIASYFDHKTTADCVEFYYKNHKSEFFEEIKKKSQLKKQDRGFPTSTYLMTSGKKWNCEVNAASLEASAYAGADADADDCLKSQNTYLNRPLLNGKKCWGDDASHEKSSSVENEREATAADALAGFCGALSSEAMSSCITSSVDEGKFKRSCVMDGWKKFTQCVDDEETCSDESCEEMDSADWSDVEKLNFVNAVRSYGKDFLKIARCVRTRSKDQCKVFFSKARKSLGLDGLEGTPMSDANGDTEDARVYEMESAIGSNQSNHNLLSKLEGSNGIEQLNQTQSDELEISGENSGTTQTMNDERVTVGEASPQGNSELDLNIEPEFTLDLNVCVEDNTVIKEACGEDMVGSSSETRNMAQGNNSDLDLNVCAEDNPEMMHIEPDSASRSTEDAKHRQTAKIDEGSSFYCFFVK